MLKPLALTKRNQEIPVSSVTPYLPGSNTLENVFKRVGKYFVKGGKILRHCKRYEYRTMAQVSQIRDGALLSVLKLDYDRRPAQTNRILNYIRSLRSANPFSCIRFKTISERRWFYRGAYKSPCEFFDKLALLPYDQRFNKVKGPGRVTNKARFDDLVSQFADWMVEFYNSCGFPSNFKQFVEDTNIKPALLAKLYKQNLFTPDEFINRGGALSGSFTTLVTTFGFSTEEAAEICYCMVVWAYKNNWKNDLVGLNSTKNMFINNNRPLPDYCDYSSMLLTLEDLYFKELLSKAIEARYRVETKILYFNLPL